MLLGNSFSRTRRRESWIQFTTPPILDYGPSVSGPRNHQHQIIPHGNARRPSPPSTRSAALVLPFGRSACSCLSVTLPTILSTKRICRTALGARPVLKDVSQCQRTEKNDRQGFPKGSIATTLQASKCLRKSVVDSVSYRPRSSSEARGRAFESRRARQ